MRTKEDGCFKVLVHCLAHSESLIKLDIKVTKEKSKQNITRDIEIKNVVTIATGDWGGDSGERGL